MLSLAHRIAGLFTLQGLCSSHPSANPKSASITAATSFTCKHKMMT